MFCRSDMILSESLFEVIKSLNNKSCIIYKMLIDYKNLFYEVSQSLQLVLLRVKYQNSHISGDILNYFEIEIEVYCEKPFSYL
jgi:hypothetical protein